MAGAPQRLSLNGERRPGGRLVIPEPPAVAVLAATLPAGLLEHLLMLVLAHLLAPLLDDGTHEAGTIADRPFPTAAWAARRACGRNRTGPLPCANRARARTGSPVAGCRTPHSSASPRPVPPTCASSATTGAPWSARQPRSPMSSARSLSSSWPWPSTAASIPPRRRRRRLRPRRRRSPPPRAGPG